MTTYRSKPGDGDDETLDDVTGQEAAGGVWPYLEDDLDESETNENVVEGDTSDLQDNGKATD
ncbi:hypothetical protein BH09PAT2_BH09PAT2_11220 [soil metagenome]